MPASCRLPKGGYGEEFECGSRVCGAVGLPTSPDRPSPVTQAGAPRGRVIAESPARNRRQGDEDRRVPHSHREDMGDGYDWTASAVQTPHSGCPKGKVCLPNLCLRLVPRPVQRLPVHSGRSRGNPDSLGFFAKLRWPLRQIESDIQDSIYRIKYFYGSKSSRCLNHCQPESARIRVPVDPRTAGYPRMRGERSITVKCTAALRAWGDRGTETHDPALLRRSAGQRRVRENDDVLTGDASVRMTPVWCGRRRLEAAAGSDGRQPRHPPAVRQRRRRPSCRG